MARARLDCGERRGASLILGNLPPDETKVLHGDLKPGSYKVYCPVKDHDAEGMKLTLTVK